MTVRRNRFDLGPEDRPAPAPATTPEAPATAEPTQPEFPTLFFAYGLTNLPLDERISILNVIRQLPQESIVAQFCRGAYDRGSMPAGAVKTEATVYKTWHQSKARWNSNEHFTVELRWVDSSRNLVPGGTCGNAHVHRNGLETIVEHATAKMVVRAPGSTTIDEYPPGTLPEYIPRPSGLPPPWTVPAPPPPATPFHPGTAGSRLPPRPPFPPLASSRIGPARTPAQYPPGIPPPPPVRRQQSEVQPAGSVGRHVDDMVDSHVNLDQWY